MAIQFLTQDQIDSIHELYVGYFDRAADPSGANYWSQYYIAQLNAGKTDAEVQADIAQQFWNAALQYNIFSAGETVESFISAVYLNVLGRDTVDDDGMEYWTGKLESGELSQGQFVRQLISDAKAFEGDATWGWVVERLNNRLEVSKYFAANADATLADEAAIEAGQAALAGVTADDTTVTSAKELIDGVDVVVTNFSLTVGQDGLVGTTSADTFKANVVQNSLGAQVNTLGSGDELNGGAGSDTLNAKITAGAYINGSASSTMPIQPETTSIETVNFQAVQSNITGEGNNTEVYVNAKDMKDVTTIASVYSDANLTIQNLTTNTSSGSNTLLSDMTVKMAYTGNDDSNWDASDFTVYFDQDYLTPEATSTDAAIEIRVMNEDAYDETDGDLPLAGVFLRELTITLNGSRYDLSQYLGENEATGKGMEITTYAELLAAVQAALVALKAATPTTDANYAAIQTLEAELGSKFYTDVDPDSLVRREGTSIKITVDGLTNGTTNVLSISSTDLELARADNATYENNNRYERADNDPADPGQVLAINVDLEKVGLAGDGGELIIGSMNKTDANEWNAVNNVTDTTSGIEQFNVTVYGNASKSSSLAGLHSTNNNLRVVNVATDANQTGTYADLTIGNSNTDATLSATPSLNNAEALKDVQTFDASAFKGDLTVYAALTDEVTAKYLTLDDEAPAAATADNVEFQYTGGTGNDYFNIALDSSNMDAAGTATREDMALNVVGGEGNDTITLAIVDDKGLAAGVKYNNVNAMEDWYDNQKLNANITISGGEGDDTIWTPGSGDVIISGGAGNDTVYADNTGSKAVWAFNVADSTIPVAYQDRHQLDDLQSDTNESYRLYNATLTVTFKGFEVTVSLPNTSGVTTDAQINQAIKLAINSDAELSKLLVAEDGPANTLVVTSLIDGEMDANDLTVDITAPTTLSAGDVQQLASWYGVTGADAASLLAIMNTAIAAFETAGDYASTDFAMNGANDVVGSESTHVSDNTITGGTGNDVLVLGTGTYSNDTLVYAGFGNGVDTIVNFDDGVQTTVTSTTVTTGRAESFTVTFNDLTATASNAEVVFDGDTILLNNGSTGVIPAEDVALAFAQQYAETNWTVTYEAGSNSVTLTSAIGVQTDVTAGDFAFGNATGTVGISNYVQGIDPYVAGTAATAEVVTVQYDTNGLGTDTAVSANGTITVLGTTINVLAGDGAVSVAAKVAAASFADWVAVLGTDETSVVFTAKTTGDVTDVVAADAGDGTLGVDASVAIVDGVDAVAATGGTWTNVTSVTTTSTLGMDYIDFTDYAVEAVYVNGTLIDGTAAVAGEKFITLVESTTNAGEYVATVYTEGGAAADTLVGVIGTLDFGASQDFTAASFLI